jgi:hypothetical protein
MLFRDSGPCVSAETWPMLKTCRFLASLAILAACFDYGQAVAAEMELRYDESDIDKYKLYRGYDAFSGEEREKCFADDDIFEKGSIENFASYMRDDSTLDARSREVIWNASANASGSYGPITAKASLSASGSSLEIDNSDSRSLALTLQWFKRTGFQKGKTDPVLTDLGKQALLQAGTLITRCGSFVVTKIEYGVEAKANVDLAFSSNEQKREFKRSLSVSADASFAKFSGGVEASQKISETARHYASNRMVTFNYVTRSLEGSKGAGKAPMALSGASDNPFSSAWTAVGDLVNGLTTDTGKPDKVIFEPIYDVLRRTEQGAKLFTSDSGVSFEKLSEIADQASIIRFLVATRELLRRRMNDLVSPRDLANRLTHEIRDRSDKAQTERILVNYIQGSCGGATEAVAGEKILTVETTLFYSYFCDRALLEDQNVDQRLRDLARDVEQRAEKCFVDRSDRVSDCLKNISNDERDVLKLSVASLGNESSLRFVSVAEEFQAFMRPLSVTEVDYLFYRWGFEPPRLIPGVGINFESFSLATPSSDGKDPEVKLIFRAPFWERKLTAERDGQNFFTCETNSPKFWPANSAKSLYRFNSQIPSKFDAWCYNVVNNVGLKATENFATLTKNDPNGVLDIKFYLEGDDYWGNGARVFIGTVKGIKNGPRIDWYLWTSRE